MRERVDQVTLTVIHNYLTSTCREMGLAMMRTAYSPIFNESLDFSCVIFNRAGRLIGQAEFCPSQIGTIKGTVEILLEELGMDAFSPGDVLLTNDPYRGCGHVPEFTVLKGVFDSEGNLLFYVANCAHMAEPGAKSPGGLAGDATDIYQEGLILPPVWLQREGKDVQDIWEIIFANHRTPEVTNGDLHAMVGSLDIAERRLNELLTRYGSDQVDLASDELLAISERRMRAEIQAIPDGVYTFEDVIEDDGIEERPLPIRVTVTVSGEDFKADFTGSAPQARGPMNANYSVTASAVYNALLHLTDSTIPRNDGCYRPIQIVAPEGTLLNCRHPAALVGGNTEISPRITDIIFGALSEALPDRVPASLGGTSCCFLFGGQHPGGEPYAHFHFEGVGWGARNEQDGNNTVVVINGNCRNTPVEIFETRYPFITECYRLLTDSGGPGKWRGGLGGERILTVTAHRITVSALFNRMTISPFGLFGGKEGARSGIYVKPAGSENFRTFQDVFGTLSPSKFSGVELKKGDQVRIVFPGGGGYGNPSERSRDAVASDVRVGFVSEDQAERAYAPKP
jgi:N-methylhydantoinase B